MVPMNCDEILQYHIKEVLYPVYLMMKVLITFSFDFFFVSNKRILLNKRLKQVKYRQVYKLLYYQYLMYWCRDHYNQDHYNHKKVHQILLFLWYGLMLIWILKKNDFFIQLDERNNRYLNNLICWIRWYIRIVFDFFCI